MPPQLVLAGQMLVLGWVCVRCKFKTQKATNLSAKIAYEFEAKLFYLNHEGLKSVRHHSVKCECSGGATLPTTTL